MGNTRIFWLTSAPSKVPAAGLRRYTGQTRTTRAALPQQAARA